MIFFWPLFSSRVVIVVKEIPWLMWIHNTAIGYHDILLTIVFFKSGDSCEGNSLVDVTLCKPLFPFLLELSGAHLRGNGVNRSINQPTDCLMQKTHQVLPFIEVACLEILAIWIQMGFPVYIFYQPCIAADYHISGDFLLMSRWQTASSSFFNSLFHV